MRSVIGSPNGSKKSEFIAALTVSTRAILTVGTAALLLRYPERPGYQRFGGAASLRKVSGAPLLVRRGLRPTASVTCAAPKASRAPLLVRFGSRFFGRGDFLVARAFRLGRGL